MSNIFPTNYTTKATPDWTDVVWSSDAVTNFNLTVASIALYTLTNNNTDSLSEWATNLYYTEARVTANSTVVAKADKSNVLELDNTAAYTPTATYHPATKDYVDWMWTNINWLTAKTTPVDADEFMIYDVAWAANKKLTSSNLFEYIDNQAKEISVVNTSILLTNTAWTQVVAHWLGKVPKKFILQIIKQNLEFTSHYWANDWIPVYSGIKYEPIWPVYTPETWYLYKHISTAWIDEITISVSSIDATNITFDRIILWSPSSWTALTCNIISE